jgi:aryl-alcohol dehydrogenase-like predicted oxidoreductase
VATLAVAWTLTHDFVGSTIIGATRAEQLSDTLAASDTALAPDVLAACNAVAKEIRYPMG